ncbi:MAG: amino acid deaminase/aldolase, partial [Myxococcales bacterium]|nr:amino acid deaminase/aldolase [Myxococcales bacterium]
PTTLNTPAFADVTLELALDVDVALSLPKLYFGVRRSPVRDVATARAVGHAVLGERGVRLVGVMGYEAQIAGLPDATGHASDLAIRALKRLSFADVRRRRGAIVDALRSDGHPIRLVNGGGTGSLDVTSRDPSVTELAAGSGLFAPTSFDAFAGFRHRPAAGFALGVMRRPSPELVTCFGGGYVASGPPSVAKVPTPWLPEGLTLLPHEMAGEVQTPLRVPSEVSLAIGDPVFFRHAKAGELCERFARLLLISGDRVVDEVATYRGEGESFG